MAGGGLSGSDRIAGGELAGLAAGRAVGLAAGLKKLEIVVCLANFSWSQ